MKNSNKETFPVLFCFVMICHFMYVLTSKSSMYDIYGVGTFFHKFAERDTRYNTVIPDITNMYQMYKVFILKTVKDDRMTRHRTTEDLECPTPKPVTGPVSCRSTTMWFTGLPRRCHL